ncbi:MAG: TIM barrel protein [Acidobacteriota bacterium]
MQRVLSTHLFVNHRLTTVWLDRIWDAGIPQVEIFCARQHLDYRDKAQIGELGYWFRDMPLKMNSLHSPMFTDEIWGRSGPQSVISITEPLKAKRIDMVDEIKRAIEIAETVPFKYLIQHLGVSGEEFDERKVDAAFTALEELSMFARQRGVEILLENTPNELSSAERLLTFFELTHMKLNVCLDAGHANMHEGIANAYRMLKPRIRSTHIHDNNGKDDLHLFPFAADCGVAVAEEADKRGTIDWVKTMGLLRQEEDQYPLLLELREPINVAHPIEAAVRCFDKLEGLRIEHE